MHAARLAALVRARLRLVLGGALALAQLIALFWFATPEGLPLDDAWIHQVVARTFAESGTLGYAPGEHGAAATSYFWAALLAVNFKWVHVDPVRWSFALCTVASLVTGQLLFALLGRAPRGEQAEPASLALAFAATLLACTSANVLWFAHSGMEASLFVALSITAIWAATAVAPSLPLALLAGGASGLVALTRPEGAPLCALLVAYVIYRRRGTPLLVRHVLAVALPAALAGLLYLGSNLAKTGRATPTTLSGRRWLWFETTAGLSGLDRASDFVGAWLTRLSSYTFDTGAPVAWIMVGLAVYGALLLVRSKSDGLRMLFAWAALHTGAYLFLLPTPGHGGRYQPFVPLLYVACIAVGTAFVVRAATRAALRGGPRIATAVSLAAIVPWLVLGLACTAKLRAAHALAVAHIQATEIGTGRFVDTLPREGAVASFDIGGIGWAARRPILDAGGLSDPATALLLEQGRIWEYLQRRDVRWVVLPEGWERVLPVVDDFVSRLHLDNPAVRLTRIHEIETPMERWAPAIAATWNAAPKQVVYRIEYTGMPGPPATAVVPSGTPARTVHDDAGLATIRDRVLAERSVAVLGAWGLRATVQLTPTPPVPLTGDGGCTVFLGPWGIEVDGCAAVANAPVLRSMLHENVGRYLDLRNFGGALRETPHVLALAKRLHDPRFHPPLAPVMSPEQSESESYVSSGLAAMLAGVGLAIGLERLVARRRRRAGSASPTGVAPAVLAALVTVCGALLASCHGADAELLQAATQGRGAVELALARGASVESRDGAGRTPLLVAAAAGDVESVGLLLARGAQVSARDLEGATALHHAARSGRFACALVLVRAGVPNDAVAGERKRSALHDATLAGSVETVRALLEAGADLRAADAFGETALHLVARTDPARTAELAALLLEGGADPTVADARGFTALHAAAVADHLPLLRAILGSARGAAAIPIETPRGETAVEVAMRYGRDRPADILLRSGAVLRVDFALPPLHEAARMDAVDRAARLLAAGADPAFIFGGRSALDVARQQHSRGVEALLTRRGPP